MSIELPELLKKLSLIECNSMANNPRKSYSPIVIKKDGPYRTEKVATVKATPKRKVVKIFNQTTNNQSGQTTQSMTKKVYKGGSLVKNKTRNVSVSRALGQIVKGYRK